MTDKEWEDFCEWCGFKQLKPGRGGYHYKVTKKEWNWLPPGETERHKSVPFLPHRNMNTLWKYAVPKLIEELAESMAQRGAVDLDFCRLYIMKRWVERWNENPEDPVEALYQAINKSSEKGEKG